MTRHSARPAVLITQRLLGGGPDTAPHDALDRRWHQYAEQCQLRLVAVPNDVAAAHALLDAAPGPRGVILSGGGDLSGLPAGQPPDPPRERVEALCLAWARDRGLGVLGVCRGAQLLWRDAGGTVTPVAEHHHGVHDLHPTDRGVRAGIRPGQVNSFHAYGLTGHPAATVPLAHAGDGALEAFSARNGRELAVMWHPERPDTTVDIGAQVARLFVKE